MPFSSSENKRWMLDRYKVIQPEVTVDVGPGCGTYSDLMREHKKGNWKAIEAWAPYVPEFNLWDKYDHVIVSDIRHCDLFTVHEGPDLVIVGDCLEHMGHAEAGQVVRRLQAWSMSMLVSIPHGEYPQDAVGGNWFEIHRATWTHERMRALLSEYGTVVAENKGKVLSSFHWSLE